MTGKRGAVLAAAVLAALAAAAASAADSLRMTPLQSVRFPDRAYVLTSRSPLRLEASGVQVRENGRLIGGVSLVPARLASPRTFGVVLALDASNSMRGAPIAAAVEAARAFAAKRAPNQPLGLVTFNSGVRVVLAPTTDAAAIRRALAASPSLAEGTRLYDGAARAVELLRAARIKAGSVVLLSDGRDIGSTLRLQTLLSRARAAGVRLFAVGLRSPQFSPAPLTRLARSTGAVYAEAGSAAGLAAIYGRLSRRLASEYLLRYRSPAGPDMAVRVEVRAAGVPGTAVASYRTPALPTTPLAPFHRSFLDRLWTSLLGAVLLSLFVGALAWAVVSFLVRRYQGSLRARIGAFVSAGGVATGRRRPRIHGATTTGFQAAVEQLLARTAWWERFKEELEIARIQVPAVLVVIGTLAATVLLMILLGSAVAPPLAVLGLGVPLAVRELIKRRLRRLRDAFAEQLADNLTVLAASLRAGHSFVGALSAVVEEADEPSRSELRRALADEQLGVPVEDALLVVARRMASGDLEQVALVAALHRQTGGNTAEVLDTVVETIRERFNLRRLVRTLTAQGRLSRWILTGLPVAVALVVAVINPAYIGTLFTTTGGQVLLVLGLVLLVAGSLMIRRIVDIEL
jgi:tight adherence protein B